MSNRVTQKALEALERLRAGWRDPDDYALIRAVLGSARPPVPPQATTTSLSIPTQSVGFDGGAREPTLEEIVKATEREVCRELSWPPGTDHEVAALVERVRARLSSPEAPR